ncbi:hypothetical protein Scep_015168 [Stephania cephalantha]|uniref:Uncharacterized protein n=1 Tax=Stephania cephalantha TaxID=152367 RepID=A0AAP0P051_9MAGN
MSRLALKINKKSFRNLSRLRFGLNETLLNVRELRENSGVWARISNCRGIG